MNDKFNLVIFYKNTPAKLFINDLKEDIVLVSCIFGRLPNEFQKITKEYYAKWKGAHLAFLDIYNKEKNDFITFEVYLTFFILICINYLIVIIESQ